MRKNEKIPENVSFGFGHSQEIGNTIINRYIPGNFDATYLL
ncbi:MAG: hypothetical protein ACOCWA_08810 [Bacteroidota bacterium]